MCDESRITPHRSASGAPTRKSQPNRAELAKKAGSRIRFVRVCSCARDLALEMRRSPAWLDAGVPRVSTFWRRCAPALAEPFQAIAYGEAGDVFDALVAELPGNTQSKRSAEWDGQLTAVHTVGDESLRVHRIGHVDAFPPVGLNRTVDNVSGLRESPYNVQDVRERHAAPFGYIRPAFFARQMSDLAAPGKALEFTQRERGRAGDHSIHGEAPAGERSLLNALERFAQWSDFVRERRFRNLVGIELTRQGVASQYPLRGISQRFARPVQAAAIGRDEPITLRELRSRRQPRGARGGDQSGGDEFTS